jgi:XapX domain-containing protein
MLARSADMKPYLLSLVIGLLVGVVYSLFGVKSPAPPVIALVGLLGILAGEQLLPLGKRLYQQVAPASAAPQQRSNPPEDPPAPH